MTESPDDVKKIQKNLEQRRKEIESALEVQKESIKPVPLDQAAVGRLSRMDAIQQQSMALATEKRLQQDLSRVGAALQRLAVGEYGMCIHCEEPIPAKRLMLDPSLLTCVKCS